ncbi:hypothetical protein [Psychroflexus sp. MES1-P1E]|nr:hypothetical protein [Psychroflexus sp. MES1-P1E]
MSKLDNGIAKNVINGYGKLIKGLQGYILYRLNSVGFGVKEFFFG